MILLVLVITHILYSASRELTSRTLDAGKGAGRRLHNGYRAKTQPYRDMGAKTWQHLSVRTLDGLLKTLGLGAVAVGATLRYGPPFTWRALRDGAAEGKRRARERYDAAGDHPTDALLPAWAQRRVDARRHAAELDAAEAEAYRMNAELDAADAEHGAGEDWTRYPDDRYTKNSSGDAAPKPCLTATPHEPHAYWRHDVWDEPQLLYCPGIPEPATTAPDPEPEPAAAARAEADDWDAAPDPDEHQYGTTDGQQPCTYTAPHPPHTWGEYDKELNARMWDCPGVPEPAEHAEPEPAAEPDTGDAASTPDGAADGTPQTPEPDEPDEPGEPSTDPLNGGTHVTTGEITDLSTAQATYQGWIDGADGLQAFADTYRAELTACGMTGGTEQGDAARILEAAAQLKTAGTGALASLNTRHGAIADAANAADQTADESQYYVPGSGGGTTSSGGGTTSSRDAMERAADTEWDAGEPRYAGSSSS